MKAKIPCILEFEDGDVRVRFHPRHLPAIASCPLIHIDKDGKGWLPGVAIIDDATCPDPAQELQGVVDMAVRRMEELRRREG